MDSLMQNMETVLEDGEVLYVNGSGVSLLEIEELTALEGFKIITYNIGSIDKNFESIERLLKIEDISNGIDILNVQETWLHKNSLFNNYNVPGYLTYRQDRPQNVKARGGGILIYYKENLNVDFKSYLAHNVSNEKIEILTYRILSKNSKALQVVTCYKPPDSFYKNLECLSPILNSFGSNTNVLLTGDLNINILHISPGKTFLENLCVSSSLNILNVTRPTHFKNFSNTLIDINAVSPDMHAISGVVLLIADKPSGHYPIFLNFDFQPALIAENICFTSRSLRKKYDFENFRNSLKNLDWSPLYNSTDTDFTWQYFISKIEQTRDNLYPLEKI